MNYRINGDFHMKAEDLIWNISHIIMKDRIIYPLIFLFIKKRYLDGRDNSFLNDRDRRHMLGMIRIPIYTMIKIKGILILFLMRGKFTEFLYL